MKYFCRRLRYALRFFVIGLAHGKPVSSFILGWRIHGWIHRDAQMYFTPSAVTDWIQANPPFDSIQCDGGLVED